MFETVDAPCNHQTGQATDLLFDQFVGEFFVVYRCRRCDRSMVTDDPVPEDLAAARYTQLAAILAPPSSL